MKKFSESRGADLVSLMNKRVARLNFILLLIAALALTSCFATIAPKEIHQRQASFTSTGQDSGILADASKQTIGFAVNQEWIDGYDSLLAKYGDKLSPARKAFDRDGIAKEGDHYRVSDAVMERKLVMNERRVNEQGP
jgi:hypothetical protein